MYAPIVIVYDTGATVDLYLLDYLTGKVYKTLNSAKGLWGASGYAATDTCKAASEVGTASGIYVVDANPSTTYPLPDG